VASVHAARAADRRSERLSRRSLRQAGRNAPRETVLPVPAEFAPPMIATDTGLRFGEAAELRWRDVDIAGLRLRVTRSVTFVGGQPIVGTPKNGKDRTVALPATVAALLASGADDALAFPDSAGGWMRASDVRRRWWAKALADAGVPTDFKLHELRHTAASLAIRSGGNIKALQNMLGHASAGLTLDRYGHLYDSDVDTLGHAINEVITVTCGQSVGMAPAVGRHLRAVSGADLPRWARTVSNRRPLVCKTRALPLSYAPVRRQDTARSAPAPKQPGEFRRSAPSAHQSTAAGRGPRRAASSRRTGSCRTGR
jgi:hypothetical protein